MLEILKTMLEIILFFVGASVFSFLNVVIYRVPRQMSFVKGRSICPSCKRNLRGIEMVPVFSWIFLKGRCYGCRERISFRYTVVELLGGFLFLLCAVYFGLNIQAVTVFAFICVLTITTFVDMDTMEIPNGFVIASGIVGIISIFVFPQVTLFERVIGIISVSLPLFLITLAVPGGFGGGDIKFMAACGLFLGWKMSLVSLFIAVLMGGAFGGWLLITKRKKGKDHFAFGPFLCIAITLTLFIGKALLKWYTNLLIFS